MLNAFEAAAAGRPKHNVHVEYFTPKAEAATSGGFWVELARSGEEYYIPEGKKILEVLYEAGIDVDYSCELGICGECVTRVISGIPEHRDSVLSEEEQASNDKVMICCAGLQERASGPGYVDISLPRPRNYAKSATDGAMVERLDGRPR